MVRTFFSLFCLVIFPTSAFAENFGVRGETFDISEPHLIRYFENKLEEMKEDGRLDEINEAMVDRTKERIFAPEPVFGLGKATEDRHFLWDPTITAPQDYLGPNGEVVVAKGKSENPLDYVSLRQPLVFIDGADDDQVDYALSIHNSSKTGAKIVLTNGRPFEIMKEHKVRVYFDQKGILTEKFGLRNLPSKITQQGRVLRVDEVFLP